MFPGKGAGASERPSASKAGVAPLKASLKLCLPVPLPKALCQFNPRPQESQSSSMLCHHASARQAIDGNFGTTRSRQQTAVWGQRAYCTRCRLPVSSSPARGGRSVAGLDAAY